MNDKLDFLKGKLLSGRVYPEFFPLRSKDCVINLGCGEGPQAIVYSEQYKKMIGVDVSKKRLEKSKKAIKIYKVKNYTTLCANVEKIPLPDNSFDKAIAIDIIEHVQNPKKMCLEVNRLLKEKGEFLVTFPAMYDKYRAFASWVNHFILKRKKKPSVLTTYGEWNPDTHNQTHSLRKWIAIIESCGFKLCKSRASTLFPPLHLYGISRFWFSNNIIHKIDSFFCKIPILKNYGQALVCAFKKQSFR